MRVYLPESLQFSNEIPHLDSAMFFVHLLYKHRLYRKYKKNEFMPLMKKHLYSQLGREECQPVLDALEAAGITECDGHWIEGEKSMGYRISDAFHHDTFRVSEISNKFLLKRLANWYAKTSAQQAPSHLRRNLQDLRVSDGAVQAAHDQFDLKMSALRGLKGKSKLRKKARYCLSGQLLAIDTLQRQDFYAYKCQYGRVHTNITNLSGALRPFLRFHEQKLVEIDIVNSQPLFLALLYLRFSSSSSLPDELCKVELSKYTYLLEELLKDDKEKGEERGGGIHCRYDCRIAISSCWEKFINAVESGHFYHKIKKHLKLENKAQAKNSFFKLTYGARKDNPLRSLYPEVIDFCDKIKHKDYRHLAHALQRAESKLMIGTVSRLLEENGIWHSTIHDSVLCLPQDAQFVRDTIINEIRNHGLTPNLKRKE